MLERSKHGQLQLIWRLVNAQKTSHDGHNTARKNRLPKRNITRCKQQTFSEDVSYHGTNQALSLAVLLEAQNGKLAAYREMETQQNYAIFLCTNFKRQTAIVPYTIVHYLKYCIRAMLRAIYASHPLSRAILYVVHSGRYFNYYRYQR